MNVTVTVIITAGPEAAVFLAVRAYARREDRTAAMGGHVYL